VEGRGSLKKKNHGYRFSLSSEREGNCATAFSVGFSSSGCSAGSLVLVLREESTDDMVPDMEMILELQSGRDGENSCRSLNNSYSSYLVCLVYFFYEQDLFHLLFSSLFNVFNNESLVGELAVAGQRALAPALHWQVWE
jgi:hypothetical protein